MKTGKIVISINEGEAPVFEFSGMINHRSMQNITRRIKREYMMYMRAVSKNSMAEKQEQYRVEQAEEVAKQQREEQEATRQRQLEDTTESLDPDIIPEEPEEANINETREGEEDGQDDEGRDAGDAEGSGYSESFEKLIGE